MHVWLITCIFGIRQLSMKIKASFLISMCWMQRPCIHQLRKATQQTFAAIVNRDIILPASAHLCVRGGDKATSCILVVNKGKVSDKAIDSSAAVRGKLFYLGRGIAIISALLPALNSTISLTQS